MTEPVKVGDASPWWTPLCLFSSDPTGPDLVYTGTKITGDTFNPCDMPTGEKSVNGKTQASLF